MKMNGVVERIGSLLVDVGVHMGRVEDDRSAWGADVWLVSVGLEVLLTT